MTSRVEAFRWRWGLGGLFAAGSVMLWLALAPPVALPARFAQEKCAHIDVLASQTGAAIAGIEDIALMPDGKTLLLSAHDRFDDAAPAGGLWLIRTADLSGLRARALPVDTTAVSAGVRRPHGVDVDTASGRVAVINRTADGGAEIAVGLIKEDRFAPEATARGKRFCRANDVAFRGETLRVSLDRVSCDWSLTDLLPGARTGRVIVLDRSMTATEEQTGLAFANGVTPSAVAETRAATIRLEDGRVVDVPGGPDNLTLDTDGALVAALHPALFRLALVRRGWIARAPSRIVRIDPSPGRVEVLFDDPAGQIISGATVGLMTEAGLVIGSAHDAGLAICR